MATEYSYPAVQTVAQNANALFLDSSRSCTRGAITHRLDSGTFRIKGSANGYKATYRVTFNCNAAISGAIEPITLALQEDGETVNNALATVTPAAVGDYWTISIDTLVTVPCACCTTLSIKNTSATEIAVRNANIIFDRVS